MNLGDLAQRITNLENDMMLVRDGSLIEHYSGTAAPTSGTWARGNVCWNTTPTAGGTPGWVCVTAGTPGTWKAIANLEA